MVRHFWGNVAKVASPSSQNFWIQDSPEPTQGQLGNALGAYLALVPSPLTNLRVIAYGSLRNCKDDVLVR